MSEAHVSGAMAPRQGTSTTEGLSLAMPVSMQVRYSVWPVPPAMAWARLSRWRR